MADTKTTYPDSNSGQGGVKRDSNSGQAGQGTDNDKNPNFPKNPNSDQR